jgi:hypothetical protein
MSGGSGTDGVWPSTTVSGFTAGAQYWFQVQVYDSVAGSYAAAAAATGEYYGESMLFQVNSSTGITPNSIVNSGGTAHSTWAPGVATVTAGNVLGLEAIALQANVPEPTTIALAGLGIASLMIFRRRK